MYTWNMCIFTSRTPVQCMCSVLAQIMSLPRQGCNKPIQTVPALELANIYIFNVSLWSQVKLSESFYLKFFFDETSAFIKAVTWKENLKIES